MSLIRPLEPYDGPSPDDPQPVYIEHLTELPCETAPAEPGQVVVRHCHGTVTRADEITDVDGELRGYDLSSTPEQTSYFYVPQNSIRLERLAWETANSTPTAKGQ
jgi:hypothetical protein